MEGGVTSTGIHPESAPGIGIDISAITAMHNNREHRVMVSIPEADGNRGYLTVPIYMP
jgi:hypothetical protein